jgi:hypothetical protein
MNKDQNKAEIAQPKKKKSLFFTSLDIFIYALVVFTGGVLVGFAFGRFKYTRFLYVEQRMTAMNANLSQKRAEYNIINKNNTEILLPMLTVMAKRASDQICTKNIQAVPFTNKYPTNPDILMDMGGLNLNFKDASDTKWQSSVEYTQSAPDNLVVRKFTPAGQNYYACFVAVPKKGDVE